jgi:putative transferase (TIGR04331 family)
MNINFVVSVYNKVWVDGLRNLFVIDPYILYYLKKNEILNNYNNVELLPSPRSTKQELIDDHNFVDEKYKKYILILSERLNKVHKKNYTVFFWKKCISLSLLRNITFIYDMFQRCDSSFDPEIHFCKILSEQSYYTPIDFNDHRIFFQSTAYGQEQMFSIYMKSFYPNKYESISDNFVWPNIKKKERGNLINSFFHRLLRITPSIFFIRFTKFLNYFKSPSVVIIESFFNSKDLFEIIKKSKYKTQNLTIKKSFKVQSNLNIEKRDVLSKLNSDFDKFDIYFFNSIKYCFPKIFVENFETIYIHYNKYFNRFKKLEYVVNESWIGDNYASIAIAILQQKGVRHICNEHNYLSHQFLCNNCKYVIPLTDKYLTLGWFKEGYENLVKSGSLFEWVHNREFKKEYDILYINGPPAVKIPEMNAAYGHFGGYNANLHYNFVHTFFSNLSSKNLYNSVFRGYPVDQYPVSHIEPQMFMYDQKYLFNEYLKFFKVVDYSSTSAKIFIKKSRLIIIDYLSTSYLESILADIPTIFFWNENAYPLEMEYIGFYDKLISVGICQTDPIQAAAFVDKIIENPEDWWNSEVVQKARNEFISLNFGNKEVLKSYILNL